MNTEKMRESGQWWTDSLNPTIGCTHVNKLCDNCYAEKMAIRLNGIFAAKGDDDSWARYSNVLKFDYSENELGEAIGWNGHIELCYNRLDKPLHWREPRIIFVDSMSDLFHPSIPFEFIDKVMAVIALCPQHTFLICTKRIERAKEYFSYMQESGGISEFLHQKIIGDGEWADYNHWLILHPNEGDDSGNPTGWYEIDHGDFDFENLWLGCTPSKPEDIETLLEIPAAHHWVSYEPLLEKPDLPLPCKNQKFWSNISWLVTGCETGANARYCPIENIESVVNQCEAAGVMVWVKSVDIGTPEKFRQVHNFSDLPLSVRKREAPFVGDRK